MPSLSYLLSSRRPDMNAISSYLDAQHPVERVQEVCRLGRRAQARLFDAAAGYRPIGLDDIVPTDQPLQQVVHEGLNSLPAFRRFAKVFCRTDHRESGTKLWGYNRNPFFVAHAVGPGYFVAEPYGSGEVLVDYLQLPDGKPDHWPTILRNDERLGRFVYNGTQDVLRGVSDHVSIGRAMKNGKFLNAWFVLCRVDQGPR